ncbi:energy transducer TonB [Microbulbifer pacificus]|uniref:energy transducer TonB n=1 Tax=Microbulbifer pacificus TaxID=407164 RepID=UPI000CF536B9|nr:energy transducer TonB [Microbulbifer pacificus]
MEQAYLLPSNPHFFIPSNTSALVRSGAFALGVTGLLLFGMTKLIATDYRVPPDDPIPKVLDIHMPKMTTTVHQSEPALKPQDVPPPLPRVEVNRQVEPQDLSTVISPPVVSDEKRGPIPVTADPLPIYKPAPQYPRRALARGIEGYVVVEFTITSNGSVKNPRVVGGYDSAGMPTDVFNSAALNAVERFKYRPPMSEGQAVEQHGVRNRISFKLAE